MSILNITGGNMQDYENRQLTKTELAGVIAAFLMFFATGMIMGGSSVGNNKVFYTGAVLFTLGAAIAVYLLFFHGKKEEDF